VTDGCTDRQTDQGTELPQLLQRYALQATWPSCKNDVNLVVLSFISLSIRFLSAADTATCMVGASFSEKPVENNS